MTLIPVSKSSVFDSSWSNAGGLRWIGQRSVISIASSLLRMSPVTLNTLPLVTSPTGTVMGLPVSRTSWPRTSPSVGLSAMARMTSSPRCCATSRVISVDSEPMVIVVLRAL